VCYQGFYAPRKLWLFIIVLSGPGIVMNIFGFRKVLGKQPHSVAFSVWMQFGTNVVFISQNHIRQIRTIDKNLANTNAMSRQ